MEALIRSLLAWFALPEHGLSTVFGVAFASATLLPMGSEPAVFGFAKLNPGQFWVVVLVATAGNTLGGALDYWLGLGAHEAIAHGKRTRYLGWFERLGPKALLFSWLPLVGDPLCALAGWLRMPFWPSFGWMALGKFLRYTLVTASLLWVPNAWWQLLLHPFAGLQAIGRLG
ncbi:MAG: DedA family protein [Burkholderiaceae bacterium]|nr:DedA family protein [Burkholderiaceae bacterium]